ncbi:MAG TPA: hypothetical protein VE130_14410 [Nitrososphaeraceae archaeon]|jgi:uncharacterized membrane-anchored protein YhcB (DUF1043 family)|nr:hypothetical protein [Nitrososphaeraceae archaeon]
MGTPRRKQGIEPAIVVGVVVGSMIFGLYGSIQQQEVLAANVEDIRETYLQDAHNALEAGNTTGALQNILTILDWEFNEAYPSVETYLGNLSVTASG